MGSRHRRHGVRARKEGKPVGRGRDAPSHALGTMAAYAIARSATRTSTVFERSFTVLYALPYLAVIIPLFSITGDLGLRSNPLGIGLVFGASWLFLTVILMYGFFASFPNDVIEAAKTGGASELRIFWTHVVPMSKGAILSCVLLVFIYSWNNLSHTLPLLVDPASTTVAPGLLLLSAQCSVDLGAQFAGIVISIVPLVLAYALIHKLPRRFVPVDTSPMSNTAMRLTPVSRRTPLRVRGPRHTTRSSRRS